MKKKVFAVLTALAVMTVGTLAVSAASPTVATAEAPVSTQASTTSVAATSSPETYASATKASTGFEVESVPETTVKSAAVAVQNQLLNDVAKIASQLGNSALASAATDSSQKVTASILTVVEVNATSATKDSSGNYVVTLNISGISSGDAIAVLHYNGSEWETIVPSKVASGAVTFSTASLSPISVVKLETSKTTSSPQTGETLPAAVLLIFAGIAGAAVCGRKAFA